MRCRPGGCGGSARGRRRGSAAAALPVDAAELGRLRGQIGSRRLWLAASTHAGEEAIAAAVHRRLVPAHDGLLTIIAPRHPSRGAEIAAMLAGLGMSVARRSARQPITQQTDIYLADTMGELGLFYALAGITFVGGSLARKGGHNPFEAARLDCAVLHGPAMRNCAGMAAALAAAGASEIVADDTQLARAVAALLARPRLQAERAAAGARAAAAGRSVLDAVAERLAPWLDQLAAAAVADCEGGECSSLPLRA
jgi:3-deoxy-D-manno-octulosonic-acid transferase